MAVLSHNSPPKKEANLCDTVLNNAIVTFCVCLLVATLAAKGNLLVTMLSFPIDFLGLLLLLFLSLFVSWSAVGHLNQGQWKESILLYLMLYYLAFGIFQTGIQRAGLIQLALSVNLNDPDSHRKLNNEYLCSIHHRWDFYYPFTFLRSHIVDTEQNVAEKVQP